MEVQATNTQKNTTVKANYNLGESLEAAVGLFGSEVVFGLFVQQAKIRVQALIRADIDADKTPEEIQAHLDGYTLGSITRTPGKGKKSVLEQYLAMSPEEQAKFLAEAKAKAQEAATN